MAGWIGVDFDGTLAHYGGVGSHGQKPVAPILPMVNRVRDWLIQGKTVKILTARAGIPELVEDVKMWLKEQGLPDLDVTGTKDMGMIEMWDDRCVSVETNTGRVLTEGRGDE